MKTTLYATCYYLAQLGFSGKQNLRHVASMGGCAHENVNLHV